jgi:phosphoribosylanthranilate isomerase
MALKTKVKVGKITNLSDARYCAGMGVDLLGFPIGSAHDIDAKKYKEITDWVSGPAFVAEWSNDTTGNLEEVINSYNADFVEISVRQLQFVGTLAKPLIVKLAPEEWAPYKDELLKSKSRIAFLILIKPESSVSGVVPWHEMKDFSILLSVPDFSYSIDATLELPIEGIALTGSEEVRPGLKEYGNLSSILEALEVLD